MKAQAFSCLSVLIILFLVALPVKAQEDQTTVPDSISKKSSTSNITSMYLQKNAISASDVNNGALIYSVSPLPDATASIIDTVGYLLKSSIARAYEYNTLPTTDIINIADKESKSRDNKVSKPGDKEPKSEAEETKSKDKGSKSEDKESKSRDKESKSEDKESKSEDKGSKSRDKESGSEDVESESEDEEAGSEDVESESEDEESGSEDVELKSEDEESGSEDVELKSEDEESNSEDVESKSEDEESRSEDKGATAEDEEAKSEDVEPRSEDEGAKSKVEESRSEDEESKSEDKESRSEDVEARSEDEEYGQLNHKIELLQKKIPEGHYYPWTEFSLNERIKICKFSLEILDHTEERLIFEEAHGLPRTATWSFIANTKIHVSDLLGELLAHKEQRVKPANTESKPDDKGFKPEDTELATEVMDPAPEVVESTLENCPPVVNPSVPTPDTAGTPPTYATSNLPEDRASLGTESGTYSSTPSTDGSYSATPSTVMDGKSTPESEAIEEVKPFQSTDFILNSLTITPGKIASGEDVTVSFVIINEGNYGGDYQITCTLDGNSVHSQDVYISGNSRKKLVLTVISQEVGTHIVAINDVLVGRFMVEESPVTPFRQTELAAQQPGQDETGLTESSLSDLEYSSDTKNWRVDIILLGIAGSLLVLVAGVIVALHRNSSTTV